MSITTIAVPEQPPASQLKRTPIRGRLFASRIIYEWTNHQKSVKKDAVAA